jgi:hypothetical protein
MTIRELMGRIRPGQFWGTLGAVAGLVVAAFLLGNYVTQFRVDYTQQKVQAAEDHIKDLKEQLDKGAARQQQVEAKQEFLVRYLRYMTYREMLRAHHTPENQAKFTQAETMLVHLLKRWWAQHQDAKTKFVFGQLQKESLDPAGARIVFADGSEWPIPKEVKEKVHSGGI